MKKLLVLTLLILSALAVSAADIPAVPSPAGPAAAIAPDTAPAQPDVAAALGIPAPRLVSLCNDTCIADFKICRDSCHSLTCYNQCRAALDVCQAGC